METRIMRTSLLAAVIAPSLALAQAPPTAASGGQPAPPYQDHVVIVFDASGSMCDPMGFAEERKLVVAKRALKAVKRHIPTNTAVGLLVFNQDRSDRWTYSLGARDDAKLDRAIEGIECGGGTPLGEYMKLGADRLLQEREKQRRYGFYRLLVVTDGDASDDELMEQYTPEIMGRGITLDVIGVAMEKDHTLQRYAHSYRRADDPGTLERAIREALAERVDLSDQTGGGDAFALIAGLDPGLARTIIDELGKMPNHPIGTQPSVASTGGGGGGSAGGGGGGGPTSVGPPGACGCSLADSRQPQATSIGPLALLGFLRFARKRRAAARARVRSSRVG